MGAQEFNTVDVVRLEVETDPTGLANMVQNPSGELGGWGWITTLAGTAVAGGDALTYSGVAGASNFTTEAMPVAAGQYVSARWNAVSGTVGFFRARFEWLDAAGGLLSSSTQTGYLARNSGVSTVAAIVAPASTAYVRLRFDLYATNTGTNHAGAHTWTFDGVTVAKAATAGALQTIRSNLIPNPSMETDTKGWISGNSNTTIARSTAQAQTGSASLSLTSSGVSSTMVAKTIRLPVSGSTSYVASAYSRAATIARGFDITVQFYDANDAFISSTISSSSANSTSGWGREGLLVTTPSNAASLTINPTIWISSGSIPAGEVHYIDAVMLEKAATLGTYFDSATPDAGGWDYASANQAPVITSVRTNHLPNPSMETNATGWTAGSNTTIARSTAQAQAGSASLALTKTVGIGTAYAEALTGTSGRPVVAGKSYRLSGYARAGTTGRSVNVGLRIYDAAGTALNTSFSVAVTDSNSGWVRFSTTFTASGVLSVEPTAAFVGIRVSASNAAVSEVHYVDALMFEEYTGTAPVDTYFDGSTADGTGDFTVIDNAWTGTAHASTSTQTTTLTLPYSTATLSALSFIEPVQYLNVIAESHEIRIRRDGLNVGELSATIVSAALDPADSNLIRPGRRARLTTLISGVWETVLAGKLLEADVTYDLKNPNIPDEKRARIEVLILDATQTLANAKRPEGVATIDELPFVLEGAGVPWNVNGSGNQVAVADVTTYSDGASALNQVALTRDTALGYAWMSRPGVCNVWDASEIPSGSPLVLDESDYSDLKPSFSTKACINEVTVVVQSLGVDGTTVETSYGPYRDAESIDEWGAFSKTFTVTGLDTAAVEALAAAVLAANGTPRVRVNSVTLPLTTLARVAEKALTDLYDQVNVTNVLKGIDDTLRVTAIEHIIDTDGWMVTLAFADEGGVAMPVFQPPVQSGARPDVGVIELFAGPTGNIPPSKLLCDGSSKLVADYPYLFAVIGYTFGGAGASFNVPNLTDRFPIGSGTKALGTTGGAATKVLTAANLPPHAHTINHDHDLEYSAATGTGLLVPRGTSTALGPSSTGINAFNGNSGNGPGTSTPVDILNPWLSLNFVIRAV